jgi:hypothetical protein
VLLVRTKFFNWWMAVKRISQNPGGQVSDYLSDGLVIICDQSPM